MTVGSGVYLYIIERSRRLHRRFSTLSLIRRSIHIGLYYYKSALCAARRCSAYSRKTHSPPARCENNNP